MSEPGPAGGRKRPSLLRLLLNQPRAFEREPRSNRVHLFSGQQHLGAGELLDESEGGARLWAESAFALREARFILNAATGIISTAELAWQRGYEAGYRYVHVQSVRAFSIDPTIEHIRDFWVSLPSEHGEIAPGGAFMKGR